MKHSIKHKTNGSRIGRLIFVLACALPAASAFSQQAEPDEAREPVEVAVATAVSENKSNPLLETSVNVVANAGDVEASVFRIVDRDLAKSRISQLVAETKTAMWKAKIMEMQDDEVERTSIVVAWAGPELQRIKVKTGRGAGKTLLVRGDMVSSGWIKVRHTSSMVRTLRGNSLKLNGYLDDLAHLLTDWESVTLTEEGDDWIVEFIASNGVDTRLWLNSTSLKASKLEAREEGALVGVYEYDQVVYNPKFPPKFWKK